MSEAVPERSFEPRILMVSQRMLPYVAGAETKAFNLSRALIADGANVEIVTSRFRRDLPAKERIGGVPIRRLPNIRRWRSDPGREGELALRSSQFSSAAAFALLKAGSIDLVHAHCLSATSLGFAIGARLRRAPILMEPSLGGEDGEIRKLVESPAAGFMRRVLGLVDRFAVVNHLIAAELEGIGIPRARFVFVDNGVDRERFKPATVEERLRLRERLGLSDAPVALFAGRLTERKGIRPLLEAWSQVEETIEGAVLLIAGEGPEASTVGSYAGKPDSGIRFTGIAPELADLMRAADVLVLPSRNESFGNVLIEAMACGIPVITARTGVAARLDIDRVAGLVIDPDQRRSISEALCEILGSPDRGRSMGSKGPEMASQFDFVKVARQYRAIYDSMIEMK